VLLARHTDTQFPDITPHNYKFILLIKTALTDICLHHHLTHQPSKSSKTNYTGLALRDRRRATRARISLTLTTNLSTSPSTPTSDHSTSQTLTNSFVRCAACSLMSATRMSSYSITQETSTTSRRTLASSWGHSWSSS